MPNIRIRILLICLMLCLTACGRWGQDNPPDPPGSPLAEPDRGDYNWKTEDWRHGEDQSSGESLYVGKYISGLEYQPDLEYDASSHRYRFLGADFYGLDRFRTGADSSRPWLCYLSGYEDATGEIWHQRIELPEMEEYKDAELSVSSFDIRDSQEYVLFTQIVQENETLAYLAMRFSFEGEFLGSVDLYPVIRQNGYHLEGMVSISSIRVDYAGRYFVQSFSGDKFTVLDPEGNPLTELTWDKPDTRCSYAMKTEEGEIVFEQYSLSEETMRLVMYDPDTGGERVFAEQLPIQSPKSISSDGILYYGHQGRLYRWNLRTGDRGICFDYEQLGIGRNEYAMFIGISDDGMPVIMDLSREKAMIYKLSDEPGEEGDAVHLVSLVEDSSFIAAGAILFSQEHPEHPLEVRQPEGDLTSFRTRVLAELTSGKGADIYYVSGEDMRTLHEKGVLADLGRVLDQGLRSSLYQGALSCGMIEDQQAGIPLEAYVNTLFISDELWPEDSWTLEEALSLMDGHPEFTRIITGSRYMAKINALRLLLLQDLPNSPFLDMDAGSCDFDNPLFIKALETVQNATGGDGNVAAVRDGSAAALLIHMENFREFSADLTSLGEGFHPVGFPTGSGNGSYWNADYFLVVNAQARYRETVDAFLISLFDEQWQRELSHPIRRDLLEASICYMADSPESPWQYSIGSNMYYGLSTRPDGTPWTAEYKDILDRAVPRSQNTRFIEDIILEEAAAYLSGRKTAQQVAATTQNRVQLYLNEQK